MTRLGGYERYLAVVKSQLEAALTKHVTAAVAVAAELIRRTNPR
jgi:hypothetical protein